MNAGIDLSGYAFETLHINGEFKLERGRPPGADVPILVLSPEHPHTEDASRQRLEHEYGLVSELDAAWAACPLALTRHKGRPVLVLADPGGTPLDLRLSCPLELGYFLTVAVGLTAALGQVHARGLLHKDIKPANVLADESGKVWLTGFGLACKIPIERPAVTPIHVIRGTWAYMAPEQTGRVNRFADIRSDLYSLGVTLFEMLTGTLPFVASDPLEWIHCHVARQPPSPKALRPDVPEPLDRMILKLLAKTGEDRYQTAAGIESDLRRCLDQWKAIGLIDTFAIASNDIPMGLPLPNALYGRDGHVAAMLSAFERVSSTGQMEIVLVSGPAGIGKSAIVKELQRNLVTTSGLFASGKSDQYKVGIPYPTMAHALQGLVRRILSVESAELERWRRQLLEALGPNGQLMINLVPELAVIIGAQPPPPDLPPQETQNRFHIVFRRFLGVFAQPSHPLTLFIDDLQWLDTATIELIERLAQEASLPHLLLIGAYRDDDLGSGHRLNCALEVMRTAKLQPVEIRVPPLTRTELTQLTAEMLRATRHRVRPLARILFDKTKGNPFFAVQFLKTLRDEGMLVFNGEEDTWRWDVDRIAAQRISDNVAELLAGKLTRLAPDVLATVEDLACLGNGASLAILALVIGRSERETSELLRDTLRAGFLLQVDGGYVFSHDRMQEAAYSLIAIQERAANHLRIGRALLRELSPAGMQEHLFEVVDQFRRGAALMDLSVEHECIAQLFLEAGTRAKTSTAYLSALKYFRDGASLLVPDNWDRHYDLAFGLDIQQAECEFLTGDQSAAAERLAVLSLRTRNLVDGAAVARLRIALYTLSDPNRAVDVGLAFLRQVQIEWPSHPTERALRDEVATMNRLLARRTVEQLISLPRMHDAAWLAQMDVLASLILPAKITDHNLESLVIVRMANISLEQGNCDASAYAYSQLNVVLGLRFGDYHRGISFGQLGCDLVDQHGLDRFKARVYGCFSAYGLPWTRHLPACLDLNRRAMTAADTAGDLVFVSAAARTNAGNLLISGEPLLAVQIEAEEYFRLARKAGFDAAADGAISMLMLIHELRGIRDGVALTEPALFDQPRFECALASGNDASNISRAFYWVDQLQVRFLLHDSASALAAESQAATALTAHRTMFDLADYHFYAALVRAAACDADPLNRERHFDSLELHHRQIRVWAGNCPENFGCRAALVGAEIARLERSDSDALHLYTEAIRLAQDNGFVQNEAIANELVAHFHRQRGDFALANSHLRQALSGYQRWGADAKVRRLRHEHAELGDTPPPNVRAIVLGDNLQHLDLAAVIEMSQAVSSEVVFDRLVERLMVTVVEHAGAVRGLMLLPRENEVNVAAEAVASHGSVAVNLRYSEAGPRAYPASIVNYVMRSHDFVILEDCACANPYSGDHYVIRAKPRSVLCMPLLKQTRLVGILYIENGLLPGVFTPERLVVLQILASQAAISIENAKLFADLKETKEQARRAEERNQQLFDMIPALAWRVTPGGVVDAINKQWTDYTGISTAQAALGEWVRAYPGAEGQSALNQYGQIFSKGVPGTVETWLRRHDGTLRWFLHRVAPLYDARGEIVCWHGTATDIDDLKRAEALIVSQKNLLQMSIDTHSMEQILESLVISIEAQIDGAVAALMLRDPSTAQFRYMAAPHLPSQFTTMLAATHGGPFAAGSSVQADSAQSVLVSGLLDDSDWAAYRDVTLPARLAVCWSIPILATNGVSLGTLAIYLREPRPITHREIRVCEQFSHLASVILERKQSADTLTAINQQLQQSLGEKESLLKEVHHRVKNNLQLISSMLNLQASRITDQSVAELFSESRNRVRSMALVHENLYRAGNFSKISMAGHIESLSASLARAYGMNTGHIELITSVEDIELGLDTAISVGLIINELTSNALKHAFPGGMQGCVRVRLARYEGHRCVLTVADNGVGLPQGIDRGQSVSMGLQLVHDLAEQLHGEVAVTRDKGTCFEVTFTPEETLEARM